MNVEKLAEETFGPMKLMRLDGGYVEGYLVELKQLQKFVAKVSNCYESFEEWFWNEYRITYSYSEEYRPKLFSKNEDGSYRLVMVNDSYSAYKAGKTPHEEEIMEVLNMALQQVKEYRESINISSQVLNLGKGVTKDQDIVISKCKQILSIGS